MKRVWTDEMKSYVLAIYKGRYLGDIKDMINKKFGLNLTLGSVKAYLCNHHLSTGFKNDGRNIRVVFPPEKAEWIKSNRYGHTLADFTVLFNKHFHCNYKASQINSFCGAHHILSGFDGRFKKGNIPPNKGKKGQCALGCKKTWFEKGHVPVNTVPVGTETVTKDGYIRIKIAEPNKWELKHRIIWEKYHGPLAHGDAIIFLDGNNQNCDINNLRLVTRSELAVLNTRRRIQYGDPELNQAGITLTRIELALAGKDKK